MKAKILIENGFINLKDRKNYLLSCKIIEGKIDVGDILFFNNKEVLKITEVETTNLDSLYGLCTIGVSKCFPDSYKINELYGQILTVFKLTPTT